MSRMTNLELSDSIKDYIKELFYDNIKQVLVNNTNTIIKLNETIDELNICSMAKNGFERVYIQLFY